MHMNFFEKKESENGLFIYAISLLFLLILLRTAWLSDDAAITLRTVLNFVHGFGPTFNIDERVQAYTHPFWFFILSFGYLILGNVFYTAFFISITISTVAFALLLRSSSSNKFVIVLIGLAVVLSKAFVDFSTSGLENPLSHLLLLFIVLSASSILEKERDRLIIFFLLCSSLYLNRPDLTVIVFPLAVYVALSAINRPKRLAATLTIAMVPVITWIAFSLFYYGFPFPNTAYAKLGTGITIDERIIQGFRYLLHSLATDPITIFVIVAGATIGLLGSRLSKSLSFGVMLYLMYVLYIGGDFMEGRFFTAPFFMSLIIFAREISIRPLAIALIIPIAILGSINVYPNLLAGSAYSDRKIKINGIADERGFYYQSSGLLTARRNTFTPPPWNVSERKVHTVCGGLGYKSIINGPGAHYIDDCALADPLLARLPAKERTRWRIGHFHRQLPTDYIESIKQGKNLLADQKTKLYYDSIRTVTRGALFNKDRFVEIARLNFGLVQKPDWEMYRTKYIPQSTQIPVVTESDVKTIRAEGSLWNAPGNFVFDDSIYITLDKSKNIESIDILVDNNDIYEISGLQNHEWILLTTISPVYTPGLARHKIVFKEFFSNIEKIRVTAKFGDRMYSIGHLLLNTP